MASVIRANAVGDLIDKELELAVKEHGEFFNSRHEGYGVLIEEFDEMTEEYEKFRNELNELRGLLRDDGADLLELTNRMNITGRLLITEAAQVAAMVCKFSNSIIADYKG